MRLSGEVSVAKMATVVGLPASATRTEVEDALAADAFIAHHFPELGDSVARFPAAGVDDDDGPNTLDEWQRGAAPRTLGYGNQGGQGGQQVAASTNALGGQASGGATGSSLSLYLLRQLLRLPPTATEQDVREFLESAKGRGLAHSLGLNLP